MSPDRKTGISESAEIIDEVTKSHILFLTTELPVRMCPKRNGYSLTAEDLPFFDTLSDGWKKTEREMDEMGDELKQEGKYFHPNGGSVFMDYKILRNRQPEKLSIESVPKRFRVDMTY